MMSTTLPSSPTSAMILVEVNPSRIQTQAGDPQVEAIVRIQNLSNILEQYSIEIVGLEPGWYTIPETSVGLFPQDQEEVRIAFHPPKQPGLRAGAYPFQVRVRSRGGILAESVGGVLDVRGNAVFRMDLLPRRQTGRPWRSGRYRIRLTNVGSDVHLKLEGQDPDHVCRFRITNDEPALLAGGSTTEVSMSVRVAQGWVGPTQSYDFLLSARPQDARGDPQMLPGQYIFTPLWRTWWQPVRVLLIGVALVGLLFLAAVAVNSSWIQTGWAQVETGFPAGRGWVCNRLPFGLKSLCPPSVIGPSPELNARCAYRNGFQLFHMAEQDLIGDCLTDEIADEFGNSHQYTSRGELIWVKGSNTVYLVTSNGETKDYRVWGWSNGQSRLLDDPGATPVPTLAATPTP